MSPPRRVDSLYSSYTESTASLVSSHPLSHVSPASPTAHFRQRSLPDSNKAHSTYQDGAIPSSPSPWAQTRVRNRRSKLRGEALSGELCTDLFIVYSQPDSVSDFDVDDPYSSAGQSCVDSHSGGTRRREYGAVGGAPGVRPVDEGWVFFRRLRILFGGADDEIVWQVYGRDGRSPSRSGTTGSEGWLCEIRERPQRLQQEWMERAGVFQPPHTHGESHESVCSLLKGADRFVPQVLGLGLVAVFAGARLPPTPRVPKLTPFRLLAYPVISHFSDHSYVNTTSYIGPAIPVTSPAPVVVTPPVGTGGLLNNNAPNISNRALIDPQTPTSVYKKTGINGDAMTLVFSDEFDIAGRTFYMGEDP